MWKSTSVYWLAQSSSNPAFGKRGNQAILTVNPIYLPMLFDTLTWLAVGLAGVADGNFEADKLYQDILSYYRKEVRPVKNETDKVVVKFGSSLIRLIGLDEKKQVMTINLWLDYEWNDPFLTWNPSDYGGVKKLHIPSQMLWRPDIVLYDNAAGDPHVTIFTDAVVYFDGTVVWKPPAIYKSFCQMEMKWFPFDEQLCDMKFGGWTNDGAVMDMRQKPTQGEIVKMLDYDKNGKLQTIWYNRVGMDLSYYYRNAAWDLMNVTSKRHEQVYPGCCGLDYFIDITFSLKFRRKPLFFAVNLLIPCMLIAFLTTFVFYLPPQGHKMTFAISIMVTLTVFFLVLVDLIPPVSVNIPLIGVYLLFTMMLVSISILVSTINLNIHHRSGATHKMPRWVRWLFLERLPRYLFVKPLQSEENRRRQIREEPESYFIGNSSVKLLKKPPPNLSLADTQKLAYYREPSPGFEIEPRSTQGPSFTHIYHPDVIRRLISCVNVIANHFKQLEEESKLNDEWSHVAMVMDRLFLIAFTIVNSVGSAVIVLQAPSLWDRSMPMDLPEANQPLGGDTLSIHYN